jgi:Domain of unknown function (DUF1833)
MPATFDEAFALWLTQHGNERAIAVNVLEFRHEKWNIGGHGIFVSDFGEPFTATTEEPYTFTADMLGFEIDVAADNVTTEQRLQIKIDNVNGLVAQQLRSLDDDDIQKPVLVIYRVYLDTDRSGPAIDPLSLYCVAVTMTRALVEIEASADLLPNVSAGTRYVIEEFPPLVWL